MWRIDDPQGRESLKIKYEIVQYTRGTGIDVGCGDKKLYDHFIGVDNLNHEQFGWNIKPDIISEATDLKLFASGSLDFVFSSHVLEHIEDAPKALKEWFRVLRCGGYLVLYLPHEDLYPKLGEPGANPDHKHNLNQDKVIGWMPKGWDLVVNEYRDHDNGPGEHGNEYSFLQVYKKRSDKKNAHPWKNPKPEKTCAVVRYGGFGDMIQASSILPSLKAAGYHVTFFTTPRGKDILKHDPHIDQFHLQDTDQVPNHELTSFWEAHENKYDKWVNLSESVEGTLLAMPSRPNHRWPKDIRHKIMNINYLEFTHDLAGVPHDFAPKFYPTDDEVRWAKKQAEDMGGTIIMWSLAGSSVHKFWPHLDNVIARLMLETDVKVLLVGDDLCRILEQGWEKEPRVFLRSGEWSIRQSMVFAQHGASMVIGPETGLLNAVGHEDVPKVITLSHSSPENLVKHWHATTALSANVDCYPCHRLHYGAQYCHLDKETNAAICQQAIDVDSLYNAVIYWLDVLKKVA